MSILIITEKTSQARDLRAALGDRFGQILPAEGHLLRLAEPHEVEASWKNWTCVLLKPDGLYPTRPATEGSKPAKLKAIGAALKRCDQVILATDCDREGQLIGQEILEHLGYRGTVQRALFTAQDPKSLRQAFNKLKPNRELRPLYEAAVARQQADQIFNLSLTRTATRTLLARGVRGVIGIGRVKTPTLAIVCLREIEIRDFRIEDYFEIVATAKVENGTFLMRHAPPAKARIRDRAVAEAIARAAAGHTGPLTVSVEDRRQAPPRLFDLPSLQKTCGRRWGWTADKTLGIAQELYDGEGKKVITYPRAEARHLTENQIADAPAIVAAMTRLRGFAHLRIDRLVIRRGKSGHFCDKALDGVSHHAIGALAVHEPFFSAKVSDVLLNSFLTGSCRKELVLNDGEKSIVRLIAEGHTNKEIASLLNVNEDAVETRRSAIMRKLDVSSYAAIVRYAVRTGLVKA
jgi:DNA topoisomerase-3